MTPNPIAFPRIVGAVADGMTIARSTMARMNVLNDPHLAAEGSLGEYAEKKLQLLRSDQKNV
jgi:hypothetical protein